jgi:membrane-associated protein
MDLIKFVVAFGYAGIFITLFAESGFFLGFFLPGDSLLFALGLYASQGFFNIWYLLGLSIAGAILGDSFGYWTGRKYGVEIFSFAQKNISRRFFKNEYI